VYCDLIEGFGQIFSAAVDGILDGYGGVSWKPVFAENLTYVLISVGIRGVWRKD
jgi:hypothetical protein